MMNYKLRRDQLREKLRRRKIDGLLVSQPENRRYLSGFTALDHSISESSGVLFIPTRESSTLLTDFRYQQQAEQETDLTVRIYTKGLLPLLATLLSEQKTKRFAFESHYTLHSFSLKLAALAEKRHITLIPVSNLIEKMRVRKTDLEIELIRQSVNLNEKVFQKTIAGLAPSIREIDLALELETAMRMAGAQSPSFNTIVASAENGALPHAVPTARKINQGDAVTIDMGLIFSGYCSDMTRNFVIGKADKTYLAVHRLVRKAQLAGMAAVRDGVIAGVVDRAARKVITDGGYGKHFGHSLGHGVGLAVHEGPRISSRSRQKLRAGMVITIEPGIYIPGWGGVRLENMVVVREDGCENLTKDTTWLDI